MLKTLLNLALTFSLLLGVTSTYSQSARSLYNSGTGVTFEAKNNEVLDSPAKKSAATEKKPQSNATPKYVGLSYSIFKEMTDGSIKKVSPKGIFKSGDRIKVEVTPNISGTLQVVNINPEGKHSILSSDTVVGGVSVTVPSKGYLKFIGSPGVEQLIFILTDVSKDKPTSANSPVSNLNVITIINACLNSNVSRSLAQDDSAGNQFNVINNDGTCVNQQQSSKNTRSLVVDLEQDTGYGVVPSESLSNGKVLTLKVKLRHE